MFVCSSGGQWMSCPRNPRPAKQPALGQNIQNEAANPKRTRCEGMCVRACVCVCVCVCGCMQEMPFPATQHNTTQGRGFARRTLNCAAMAIAWSVSEWLVQCLALSSHQPREIKPKQTPKQNTRNACFNFGCWQVRWAENKKGAHKCGRLGGLLCSQ